MNQQIKEDLCYLAQLYRDLSKGADDRADPTDDIEKALNKLEGIILVQLNQLEQP